MNVEHYVSGQRTHSSGNRSIAVTSPMDGTILGTLHPADRERAGHIVDSAVKAFESWSQVPVKDRVQPLYKFKQLVESNLSELAIVAGIEGGGGSHPPHRGRRETGIDRHNESG